MLGCLAKMMVVTIVRYIQLNTNNLACALHFVVLGPRVHML